MRIEFEGESSYIPRSNMIFFATNNSIAGPVIAFALWSALFFAMYAAEFHKKALLENIAIFLLPCIFLIPKVYNTYQAFKQVIGSLYVNKYPCSICIEFGEEIITQYKNKEFNCQVVISKAEIFRYSEYLVFKEECSVILVPQEMIKEIPNNLVPLNIKTLDFGWKGKLYEKTIREILPNR